MSVHWAAHAGHAGTCRLLCAAALQAPVFPAHASGCRCLRCAPGPRVLRLLSSSSSLPCPPQNPYQLQRKLEEMRREIRRCCAAASLCGSEERMRGTALPSSIPHTHVTGWSREAKVLPRHHPAPTGHCGPLPRLTQTLLLHQL